MQHYKTVITEVNRHNKLYYDESAPEISDAEYDSLYEKLENFEEQQGWADPDSPTVRVGNSPGKVQHKYKLYSLKKVYEKEEVDSSFTVVTPKIDGTNLTVTYKDGMIYCALTRGNGEFGDSVNHLISGIKGLPDYINNKKELVITGECVTDKKVENFRNYVSGALGLKELSELKSRKIRFIAHDLFGIELDYTVRMDFLTELGFNTVLDSNFCNKYPQDGVVYRLDDYYVSQKVGYTSKYPRFAVALKPRHIVTAISTLQEVIWDVGRTGTVNPVAIINPVILDDATITRVTLHNYEFIETNEIKLGDKLIIERAGGVIPKVIGVEEHINSNNNITISEVETQIGGEVKRVGPRLYVVDQEKFGTVKLLQHFIKILSIKGLGPQSIKKLELQHPSDLYKSQDWDLLGVNGAKIIKEIEISKNRPYKLVLASLGIPSVGKSMAEKIIKEIPKFSDLKEDIEHVEIRGIGPKIKTKILCWLDINEEWVYKLPLHLEEKEQLIVEENKLKVCMSGKADMTKAAITEYIEQYNYEVVSSLTKDCYALIYSDPNSSKVKKAKQYGIKTIEYAPNKNLILSGQI
tara:strand:+ start:19344 stop:21080 length:1737 start_codon:yes stop_codon:yes gene_type:complete